MKALYKTIDCIRPTLKHMGISGVPALYRQKKSLIKRSVQVDHRINGLQIEPTKICNQKCPMCTQPELKKDEIGHMSFDLFKKIFDQFSHVTTIKLQGLGEIFTNPDIWQMLEYLKERKVRVLFATNGMLMNDENAKRLIALGDIDVRFSVDTFDKEQYSKFRGSKAFDRVIANITRFCELRRELGRKSLGGKWYPSAEIRMVYMAENADQLEKLMRFAADVGLEQVTATYLLEKRHAQEQSDHVHSKIDGLHKDTTAQIIEDNKKLGRQLGVHLKTLTYSEDHLQKCIWPWDMPYITYDGYVTSCCHMENPKTYTFGDLKTQSFEEIWNGEEYRNMRENFLDLTKNINCRYCPYIAEEDLPAL